MILFYIGLYNWLLRIFKRSNFLKVHVWHKPDFIFFFHLQKWHDPQKRTGRPSELSHSSVELGFSLVLGVGISWSGVFTLNLRESIPNPWEIYLKSSHLGLGCFSSPRITQSFRECWGTWTCPDKCGPTWALDLNAKSSFYLFDQVVSFPFCLTKESSA